MDLLQSGPSRTASGRRRVVILAVTAAATLALLAVAGSAEAGEAQLKDTTAPTAPTFASTAYPAQGPTTVTAGGSGTITLTSTDSGKHASGVTSFAFNINGTGVNSGGIPGTAKAKGGRATITVPLADLFWGTNTLWAQAVDGAGNRSAPAAYLFFVQQSAFGPPAITR